MLRTVGSHRVGLPGAADVARRSSPRGFTHGRVPPVGAGVAETRADRYRAAPLTV